MAHSADTDKYDDFGLSPLSHKAFSKSSLPRQSKAAAQGDDAKASINFGWLVRLLFGLIILGAGIFAALTIADKRNNTPALGDRLDKEKDGREQAVQPVAPAADSAFRAGNATPTIADTVAWQALNSSPADIEAQPTEPAKPLAKPQLVESKVEKKRTDSPVSEVPALSAQAIKYYAIVGSFSDLEHALESKQKLKIRTRVIEKDGKYRLVADSTVSSKPAQFLIDSLKKKKPNWWLAKAN